MTELFKLNQDPGGWQVQGGQQDQVCQQGQGGLLEFGQFDHQNNPGPKKLKLTLRAYPTLIIGYVPLCYSASCYVQAKKNCSLGGLRKGRQFWFHSKSWRYKFWWRVLLISLAFPSFPQSQSTGSISYVYTLSPEKETIKWSNIRQIIKSKTKQTNTNKKGREIGWIFHWQASPEQNMLNTIYLSKKNI